eukprot:158338_1
MGALQTTATDSTIYLRCIHCAVEINKHGVVVSKHEYFTNIPFGAFIADYMNICNGMEKPHCLALPCWEKGEEKLRQRKDDLEHIIAAHSSKDIGHKKENELAERLLKKATDHDRDHLKTC